MLTDLENRVLSLVNKDHVTRWTQELVRIPSVYRPERGEAEEPAARWVEARLEEIGLETSFEVVEPGRPNVIGIWRGAEGGKRLMFEGHTDVVTEGDASQWTYPPFEAQIVDGKMYGRGANDMKGGLVAAICATKALVESGVKLGGDILIGAVCDEEGRMIGIKHFVEQGWADDVDAAIICEPEENHLCICQKGVMWARVTATGKMAHGAMPLTGVNSAYPMAEFLAAMRELEAAQIGAHGKHEFLGQPSLTPTILRSPVRGEAQNNVMPAQTEAVLDIRLIPGQSPEEIEDKIKSACETIHAKDERVTFEVEVLEARAPTATDRDELVVQVLDQAYRDLTGKEPVYGGVPGSTDGTILNSRAGVPIVTCGPGDIYIPHHIDEWLGLDELIEATRLYVVAAMRFLGVAEE
ncbi:MAG: M20 family metallopeptidase [Chloroflexota bacterium]|nr:M20 family metallopeptidase [Chloroflexota bacterium]